MKYVAAYLLATMGGQTSPSFADISKILGSVGIDAEPERVESLLDAVKDKSPAELISSGISKLASMPCGGAAPAAPSAGALTSSKAESAKEKEQKKEEESEAEDFGFDLFG